MTGNEEGYGGISALGCIDSLTSCSSIGQVTADLGVGKSTLGKDVPGY